MEETRADPAAERWPGDTALSHARTVRQSQGRAQQSGKLDVRRQSGAGSEQLHSASAGRDMRVSIPFCDAVKAWEGG